MGRKHTEICLVEGCSRPFYGKGLCHAHYERARKCGDVSLPIGKGKIGAFLDGLFGAEQTDDCVLWPFAFNPVNGYGVYGDEPAHRHVCRRAHGEPPFADSQAAHSCNVRLCVNQKHLRWASPKENAADKLIFGTHIATVSENNKLCKYSEDVIKNVREMRERDWSYDKISRATRISKTHVWRIVKWEARSVYLRP